jgi:hypothetical protein
LVLQQVLSKLSKLCLMLQKAVENRVGPEQRRRGTHAKDWRCSVPRCRRSHFVSSLRSHVRRWRGKPQMGGCDSLMCCLIVVWLITATWPTGVLEAYQLPMKASITRKLTAICPQSRCRLAERRSR